MWRALRVGRRTLVQLPDLSGESRDDAVDRVRGIGLTPQVHGQVDGRVHASRLVVMGELRGDVIGSARVSIGPRGRVYGDIDAVSFAISKAKQIIDLQGDRIFEA